MASVIRKNKSNFCTCFLLVSLGFLLSITFQSVRATETSEKYESSTVGNSQVTIKVINTTDTTDGSTGTSDNPTNNGNLPKTGERMQMGFIGLGLLLVILSLGLYLFKKKKEKEKQS